MTRVQRTSEDYPDARELPASLDSTPLALATFRGPTYIFESANETCLALLAKHPVIGQAVRDAWPEWVRRGLCDLLDRVYESNEPHARRGVALNVTRGEAPVAHGESFDIICLPSLDDQPSGKRLIVVVCEVTDQTRPRQLDSSVNELEAGVAERTADLAISVEHLSRTLAERDALERARDDGLRRLLSVQEEERRRIARELHDEMGGHLTGLRLGVDALRRHRTEDADDAWARLDHMIAAIDRDVHRLAHDLRPAALDDLGLVTALRHYLRDWSTLSGIDVDFCSANSEGHVSSIVESSIYRIVQEALTNVAKHAQAHAVSVVLQRKGDRIMVIVEDDGRGPHAPVSSTGPDGWGRLGMRERASILGGTIRVESGSGSGTSIFVDLPATFGESSVE